MVDLVLIGLAHPLPLSRNHYSPSSLVQAAPVPCIGTLILIVRSIWISPLSPRRLIPVVPKRTPDQAHAIFTPDTTYSVIRLPVG